MAKLKTYLDKLYNTFDKDNISPDPLEFLHKFNSPKDQEVVGLIASSLAYGRVEMILKNINYILNVMGHSPYRFVMRFDPERHTKLFDGFSHRFNNDKDIACLLYFARQMIEKSGSISGFFLKGYNPDDKNIKQAIINFSKRTLMLDCGNIYGKNRLPKNAGVYPAPFSNTMSNAFAGSGNGKRCGVRFFFPSPDDGSPCKRLNLYLRWMVRKNGVDLGLWDEIFPNKLIIPLDTHIARISKNIGLTKRKSPDWKMAEEITENLKKLDPDDPVKYDFSLCRLGILERCPRKKNEEKCSLCLIKEICIL